MKEQIIRIECEAAAVVELGELENFQGELKRLTKENMGKLKGAISGQGFSAPIFVWKSEEKNYILDGHQRVAACKELEREGWKVPALPVAWIHAENLAEAKRKLLQIASQYATISKKGLREFSVGMDLSLEDLRREIRLPEVSFDYEDQKEGEVPFATELLECNQYVVLYFDNELDWQQAQTVLSLANVQDGHKGLKRIGVGRVLRGAEIIRRLVHED